MVTKWIRVKKVAPCPVCGKIDWCGVSSDGQAASCMRVESAKPAKNGAWIHILAEPRRPLPPPRPDRPAGPPPDFSEIMDSLRYETTRPMLAALAESLGVSIAACDALDASWRAESRAWAFPMRDAAGKAVGVRLRDDKGRKWAIPGSKQGLFYWPRMPPAVGDRVLYVAEGPTDTAALMTMGYPAAGRASCMGQADQIKALCERLGFRLLIIVSDNDTAKARPDGSPWYPGIEGARALASACGVPYKIVIPPAKDIRAWLCAGATRAAFDCIERQQLWRAAPCPAV
jgi:hypothetical protein